MPKKGISQPIIAFLAIAILSIIFIGATQLSIGGFTTLSVSFLPQGIKLPGETTFSDGFIVTATVNQGSDKIVADITPELIKAQTGKDVKNRVQITVNSYDENALYDVVNFQNPYYKFKFYNAGILGNCQSDETRVTNLIAAGLDVWCYKKEQAGIYGSLTLRSIKRDVSVAVNNGLEAKLVNISSSQSGSEIKFDNRIGSVQFTGSLLTGDQAPDANLFDPYYDGLLKYWKLADPVKIDNARTKAQIVEQIYQQYLSQPSPDNFQALKAAAIGYNGGEYTQLINEDRQLSGCVLADNCWTNRRNTTDPKVLYPLDVKIGSPVLRFILKADWIGVIVEAGKPDITNVICNPFESGSQGSITGSIKNIGQQSGVFDFDLRDCPSFTLSQATNKVTLDVGESKDFIFPVSSGRIADNIQETCKVIAKDQTGLGGQDEASVTCQLKKPQFCTPGSQIPEGQCVYECKADGSGRVQKFCCPSGVQTNPDGTYTCAGAPPVEICGDNIDNNSDGKVDESPPCTGPKIPLTEIITILLGLAVLMTFYSKERDKVGLMKGAIFGSIAAILFYVVVTWIFKNIWLIIIGSILSLGALAYLGVLGAFGAFIVAMMLRKK